MPIIPFHMQLIQNWLSKILFEEMWTLKVCLRNGHAVKVIAEA